MIYLKNIISLWWSITSKYSLWSVFASSFFIIYFFLVSYPGFCKKYFLFRFSHYFRVYLISTIVLQISDFLSVRSDSPNNIFKCTNWEAPQCVIFSNILSLPITSIPQAPCSKTHTVLFLYSYCCLCILIVRPRILIVVYVYLLISMYS